MKEDQRNRYHPDSLSTGTTLIQKEFEKLGCEVSRHGTILYVKYNGKFCFLSGFKTSFTSYVARPVFGSKELTKRLLGDAGLRVPMGKLFTRKQKKEALEWVKENSPAVVKPSNGNKARGVSTNVREETFDEAWSAAKSVSGRKIIVEKHISGIEARYFVLDAKCIAVVKKRPPVVIGDGVKTISRLVEERNAFRSECNSTREKYPVVLNSHVIASLSDKGYSLDSVLPSGVAIQIHSKGGVAAGGDVENITESTAPELKKIAERAATLIPGADIVGLDIFAPDHSDPTNVDDYVILEINTGPGLMIHQYPDFGKPVDVVGMIARYCIEKMETLYAPLD
ncbi:hypothetical protein [Actibacterium pelagium]|uniref:ATP-grasp domain-containing protein n=1 Tax=Actibacterium pelagium TaxID=2029103 RepID=A0A917AFJ3_9RHOB|nr:hypothetical protein [Actibacterium pelagium]GGE47590.1 hypothetical protein GCM10011517_14260 [Actibacterium pelagium]